MRPSETFVGGRPIPAFLLSFNLADAQGESFLVEGTLAKIGDTWSGQGLWLSTTDPTQSDAWTVGTAPLSGAGYKPSVNIFLAQVIAGNPTPVAGAPLPLLEAGQLVSDAASSAPLPSPGPPPIISAAGQQVNLLTSEPASCCGQDTSLTYQWFFGDGTNSEPSTQRIVNHIWQSPGDYTVSLIVTDSTGFSKFASTLVRILPAP